MTKRKTTKTTATLGDLIRRRRDSADVRTIDSDAPNRILNDDYDAAADAEKLATAREPAVPGFRFMVRVELKHTILATYNDANEARRFCDKWNAERYVGQAYVEDCGDPASDAERRAAMAKVDPMNYSTDAAYVEACRLQRIADAKVQS